MDEILERLERITKEAELPWYEPSVATEQQEISWWRRTKSLIVALDDEDKWCTLQVRGPHMRNDMSEESLTDDSFLNLYRWLYDL